MPDRNDAPGAARVIRANVLGRRARLRPAGGADRAALLALADRLAGVAGVARILARPNTGSLIVETRREAASVLEDMERGGLIRTEPAPKPPPLRTVVLAGLAQADLGVKARTQGTLDLRTALALALLAAAGIQAARGRIAGPATTLAMTAYSLLAAGRQG